MRFLVIGLGSMGKRRIRCLKTLGYTEIYGMDTREDRRIESEKLYNIQTFIDVIEAINTIEPDAFIISVPPNLHHYYMELAINYNINFFVEASVLDTNMELIKRKVNEKGLVAAPSATLCFHPAIITISNVIKKEELGKLSNMIVYSGQYLPDWHLYESVSEYYVSNPETGGAREIVPFELTWITEIFGFPKRVCSNFRKTIDIPGALDIDDTYNFLLDYDNFLVSATVDVVSRYATRRVLINGSKKQLIWDWNLPFVKIYEPEKGKWNELRYEIGAAAEGYNPNICEDMYIKEIRSFIDTLRDAKPFINNLEKDHRVLRLLYAIEEADKTSHYVGVEK